MSFDFKSASRAELKAVYNEMSREIGDTQFLSKRELFYLPKLLNDGEQVLSFTTGYMDANSWLIALTDRQIIFLDVGFFYGVTSTTINLEMINSVTGETGAVMGKISIAHGGATWVIDNVWRGTVTPFTNKIRDAIERRRAALNPPPQMVAAPSEIAFSAPNLQSNPITQIQELSKLLEAGHISRKEFEELKAKAMRS